MRVKITVLFLECSHFNVSFCRSGLEDLRDSADRHLLEKNEIRDAVGLLKLYHQASGGTIGPQQQLQQRKEQKQQQQPEASPRKRRRDKK